MFDLSSIWLLQLQLRTYIFFYISSPIIYTYDTEIHQTSRTNLKCMLQLIATIFVGKKRKSLAYSKDASDDMWPCVHNIYVCAALIIKRSSLMLSSYIYSREINCVLITITEHLIANHVHYLLTYGSIYISKNHPTMHIGEVRVHVIRSEDVKQYDQYLSNSSGACLCEPDHINFERLGVSTFKYLSSCFI